METRFYYSAGEKMKDFKKAYLQNPKCPKCGGDVVFEDIIDTNAYDNGTYVDFCVGSCVKCGTSYTWDDTFIFSSRSKLELVEE